MKSQLLKLFAIVFISGFAAMFAVNTANAQSRLTFETPFDFHVGKEKLSAGKYELQRISYDKYLLRNAETSKTTLVCFDISTKNSGTEKPERVIFNRYGETYFLNGIFERRDADGKRIIESSYEKQIRKNGSEGEDQLAGKKSKPEKVSVNLTK